MIIFKLKKRQESRGRRQIYFYVQTKTKCKPISAFVNQPDTGKQLDRNYTAPQYSRHSCLNQTTDFSDFTTLATFLVWKIQNQYSS